MIKYNTYDIEFFKNFAIDKEGECLSSEYINVRTKLEWKCSNGHIWKAQPRKMLEGSWCPKCAIDRIRTPVDEGFFRRETEEAFYVAGFWAADGWVSKNSGGHLIAIQLSTKDLKHLKKIKAAVKSEREIRTFMTRPSELVKTSNPICELTFSSKQMFYDLEKFGVIERKTYKMRFPEWMKGHPMAHHYMRGYIDGDGCFAIAKAKGEPTHISFSMKGTKEFLEEFHDVLLNRVFNKTHPSRKELTHKDGAKYKAFDTLRYGGNGVISSIYDFLYKDATLYLERKEVIARKSKDLMVYGNPDNKKKTKCTALPFTKELLLAKAAELKSGKAIAEEFNCTNANISWWTKHLDIRDEFEKALGKVSKEEIYKRYLELGTGAAVAREVGLTNARVCQIVKEMRLEQTS